MKALIQRKRTRGSFQSSPDLVVQRSEHINCSDAFTIDSTNPAALFGVVETMYDVVVPNFRKRVAAGEVFFNDLTYEKVGSLIDSGSGERYSIEQTCSSPVLKRHIVLVGNRFPSVPAIGYNKVVPLASPLIVSDEILDMQKEVSTKVLAKRGDSDNNLFESIAEYRQALQLLRSPIKSAWRFITKNEKAIRKIRSVSDAWLTYRYGIKPLINDVEGIISGLKEKIGKIRKTSRGQLTMSKAASSLASRGNGYVNFTWSLTTHSNVIVRAMSLDEYVIGRSERIGFTAKGLVTVPWELVPYSFVADWFVNFGDYLKALVPLPSLNQLGSCLTTYQADNYAYRNISTVSAQPGVVVVIDPTIGSCSSYREVKTRRALLPASIVIKTDFKFNDAVRLADAVTLLSQRMFSLFGKR